MVGGQSVYPGYGRKILEDVAVVQHHWHSRFRVYPQNVTQTKRLTAGTPANTFGPWAEVIPINTIPFDFELVGMTVEQVSATTTYFIQLGYNVVDAVPATNMELGERRFRIASTPIARATELLEISAQKAPANSKVWGRLKTASGAEDTCDISVVLYRHLSVTEEVPLYPAFPW